jgi:hypothetical protein
MMVDMYKAEPNPFARWAMQLYLESENRRGLSIREINR